MPAMLQQEVADDRRVFGQVLGSVDMLQDADRGCVELEDCVGCCCWSEEKACAEKVVGSTLVCLWYLE